MKKVMRMLGFSIVLIGLVACESTQVTSVKDPLYANGIITRLAVYVKADNLNDRVNIENNVIDIFRQYNLVVYKTSEIIPPIREYTEAEVQTIIMKNKINAVLIIDITKKGSNHSNMTINQPYQTKGSYSYNRNTGNGSYNASTTGGPRTYDIDKPFIALEATVVDPVKNSNIWVGSAYTRGSGFSTEAGVFENTLSAIADEMVKDNLIMKK
jgi:hypothetical protein